MSTQKVEENSLPVPVDEESGDDEDLGKYMIDDDEIVEDTVEDIVEDTVEDTVEMQISENAFPSDLQDDSDFHDSNELRKVGSTRCAFRT